jgi:nucleoside-diphosphate-sugar epimerase
VNPVAVTGGAGAIGSRLVSRCLSLAAERIVAVDNLTSAMHGSFRPTRVRLVQADVCDLLDLELAAVSPTVFHLNISTRDTRDHDVIAVDNGSSNRRGR